jgi:ATP-dependent helicase/nuclease subunit A
MTLSFIPADQDARCRIRDSLDENLLVEAGAGTGKTASLVERIVQLIVTGLTTLDRVAAITFTEAAAAELRDRVRESLERNAADPGLTETERQRCRQGARDLDQAAIQTLHSFAGGLLRERPLEAGLPPSFETLDEIQADQLFQEAWEGWLDVALDDPELLPYLRAALTLGLSLGHLREAAKVFHEKYDLLEGIDFPDVPLPQARAGASLKEAALELERLCAFARLGDQDPLFCHVQVVLGLARRLQTVESGSLLEYRLLAQGRPIKFSKGRQKDWDKDPSTGQNACKVLKDILLGLEGVKQDELEGVRLASLMPLLRALRDFVLGYARERKGRGQAGFQDLLVWARDLLRDNLAVQDYFRHRYIHLLIDEFQDTDPLQMEIALFLAEDAPPDASAEARPRRWTEVRPAPGKLFVVGDSKQSIYRFRRADITLAAHLRQLLGQEALHLVQNFRSQRPVIQWVNHLFGCWMEESVGQSAYAPLAHCWDVVTDHPTSPAVGFLAQVLDEGGVEELRRLEHQSIARLLYRIREEGWPVLDPRATRQSGKECFRLAQYRDICLLLLQRTGLQTLELALEEAGVPYRLESASLVFGTQEVRDLVNCLQAIDNPADQVALAAALRSPALACSDVDLMMFVEGGGRLDYLLPETAQEGPVAMGLRVLKEYYDRRLWTHPATLIEEFVRERRLMELALAHSRPRERWRRYHFFWWSGRGPLPRLGAPLYGLSWIGWNVRKRKGPGGWKLQCPKGTRMPSE